MLSTKISLASLVALTAFSFALQPALAQFEPPDDGMGIDEIDIVLNVSDMGPGDGPPDFPPPPPPGMGEMAFDMPMPPPGMAVGAMRGGGCPVGGGGRRGGCPLGILQGENAVSDDQYEKLYQLKNRTLDQIGPKMLELSTAKRHLKDTLTQETIDEKAAKKLQGQITSLKAEIEGVKLDGKMSMMQILTAAQRKELRKAMMTGPRPGGPGGMRHMMKRFERRKGPEG